MMRFTTRSFVTDRLVSPLAVAAHDAGAANLIAGWLQHDMPLDVRIAADGPARAILTAACPSGRCAPIEAALDGAQMLLSGTSRASLIEHEARKLARARGVRAVAVVDHWVNYRPRFQRGDEYVLPDVVWVVDAYAAAAAREAFPGVSICEQPNRYLDALLAEIGPPRPPSDETRILYVLEPFRTNWSHGEMSGEFQALDFFLERLPSLGAASRLRIRLRPHPDDPPGKYDAWIERHADRFDVAMDAESPLASALTWADWVVGCETYAMVVALYAGRAVWSSLPPWAPACRLPHDGIRHLR